MGHYEYAVITINNKLYTDDARQALGNLFDIAINYFNCSPADTINAFLQSDLATQFEQLNPVFIAGKSATELFEYMKPYLGIQEPLHEIDMPIDKSSDYWYCWILALFQIETGHPYRELFETLPYEDTRAMYYPYHEAPEEKMLDYLTERWNVVHEAVPTHLARARANVGLSQSELARLSGVNLRSIQMYEQHNKNINHASADTVLRLSRALGVKMEDIMEL